MKTESFIGSALLSLVALAPLACSSTSDSANAPLDTAGAAALAGSSSTVGGATNSTAGSPSAGSSGASQSGAAGTAGTGGTGADSGGAGGSSGSVSGGAAGSASAGAGGVAGSAALDPTDLSLWKLVWSDEFEAADGTAPDAKSWTRELRTQSQTGSNNSNKELQQYTADAANSQQKGGVLAITAIKQGTTYTSARLNTLGHYSAAYGRVEARIKMPGGKGVWPAFWMLGDNKPSVGWPKCGEIDIMETKGSQIDTNHGSLHGPVYNGGNDLTATVTLPGKPKLSDDFHVYATEWSPDTVKFFVDTTLYETRTPKDMPAGGTWVFNHPFFITLNLAIGGVFDGDPSATTPFPAELLVDYVRVYTAK